MRRNHENAGIRRLPGGRRAGSALTSLSLAVMLGATTLGCSGEDVESSPGSGNEAAENALIQAHLEAHGYDTSTLQFQGDAVRVEDDMLVSRALLLDEAQAEATGTVEKGYFLTGVPNGNNKFAGKRVALSFQNGVSNAWKTALNTARDKWNAAIPLARDPGSAGTIVVSMVAMVDGRGTPITNVIAEGSTPSIGRTIKVNSNFSSRTPDAGCGGTPAVPVTIETLSASRKTYQGLHEMGHVLGFAHPPPNTSNGARFQIAGTLASTTSSGDPSYSTVMAQGCKALTSPSSDDGLSARKQYPGCIDTCETNCTFNVDPAQIGLCIAACPAQCGA